MLIYDVILDAGTTGCQQSVSLYQGDDRAKMLCITLLQNGKVYAVPQGQTVRLHGVKPDGSTISPKCFVRAGSVYYLPGADATDTQGTVRCQLGIRDRSGAVLFTPEFSMQIDASIPAPDLPEGAVEELAFDSGVVSSLPETADENTIVYLDGSGFYLYTGEAWRQFTDDETIAAIAALRAASHTHANMSVLDEITENENGKLQYKGQPIGIDVVRDFPEHVDHGTIVYDEGSGLWINGGTYAQTAWTQMTHDGDVFTVMYLWATRHSHENAGVLDKLTESNGALLFDGEPIGGGAGGMTVVETPNQLSANAPNGSVAVAVQDGTGARAVVEFPAQIADEEVETAVGEASITIGAPAYNGAAIHAAITAQDVEAVASINLADALSFDAVIVPVVSDLSDNDYTDAGLTLAADEVILAQSATKKYAFIAEILSKSDDWIVPDQIVQVDATHRNVPVFAIYAFENMTCTLFDFLTCSLHAGWNIVTATYEYSGSSYVDAPTDFRVANNANINAYIRLSTTSGSAVTAEGTEAAQLFEGLFECADELPKGIYVKLGTWKRLAEADA